MEDDMLKAESQLVDILCNLEQIYPAAFFDIMIHLVIHLPEEALEGGPIPYWWMYLFERYIKKIKNYVRNKAKPEGSIAIRQRYIDKGASISDELFALACRPSSTLISVNSCVVNGVRFVVYSRDEHRTTQNRGICSPGEKDEEMYYGQLEEILKFLYMSFKAVLLRVVQDVNHKKSSNGGVIVVEDDHDVIHDNNLSNLALFTSLNDLDFATLNIDGQSTNVDTSLDIIDVDEDNDFIDDEDGVPHDLAELMMKSLPMMMM
ncbi:zinc finger MYM-type protein 1 [Tanacetum coccineum]